jgi:hypothetical protein
MRYTRHDNATIPQLFWSKVEITEECWLWVGGKMANGYGHFAVRRNGVLTQAYSHRWAYEAMVGPIPCGFQIDHLCRVRHCVNPSHLEAVTPRINTLRGDTIQAKNAGKTTCPQGHPYDIRWRNGGRACKQCRREQRKRRGSQAKVKHQYVALPSSV